MPAKRTDNSSTTLSAEQTLDERGFFPGIIEGMKRAVLLLGLTGCATAAGVIKGDQTTLPMLIGATAADLVVTAVAASQAEGFTVGASIATALAITAVDVGVGCLLGACSSLKL